MDTISIWVKSLFQSIKGREPAKISKISRFSWFKAALQMKLRENKKPSYNTFPKAQSTIDFWGKKNNTKWQ
jgi:hypothetical protein